MKTIDEIARELHMNLPMATQEDAINFAHRFLAAMKEQMEPVCFMGRYGGDDIRDSGVMVMRDKEDFDSQRITFDSIVPLYTLEDWK